MSWSGIEDALRTWVKTATNLDDAHVIWAEQTGTRPSASFATLRLGDLVPVTSIDEVSETTNLANPAGQEIEQQVIGVRRFTVSMQLFTPDITSDATARALASKCQTALALPSVREALAAAGVTPFDLGTVQNVTVLNGTKYEGRALLEVGFYTLETVQEKTGYIETIEATNYLGPPASGTRDNIDI